MSRMVEPDLYPIRPPRTRGSAALYRRPRGRFFLGSFLPAPSRSPTSAHRRCGSPATEPNPKPAGHQHLQPPQLVAEHPIARVDTNDRVQSKPHVTTRRGARSAGRDGLSGYGDRAALGKGPSRLSDPKGLRSVQDSRPQGVRFQCVAESFEQTMKRARVCSCCRRFTLNATTTAHPADVTRRRWRAVSRAARRVLPGRG